MNQEKEKRLVEHAWLKRAANFKEKQKEREDNRIQKLQAKDNFENSNMGDYQNLYPIPRGVTREHDKLMDLYDAIYLKVARQVFLDSIQANAGVKNKLREEMDEQANIVLKANQKDSPDKRIAHKHLSMFDDILKQ